MIPFQYLLKSRSNTTIVLTITADIHSVPFPSPRHCSHTYPCNNTLATHGSLMTHVPPSLPHAIERRLREGEGPRAHGKHGEQSSYLVPCLQDARWNVRLLQLDHQTCRPKRGVYDYERFGMAQCCVSASKFNSLKV